MGQFQSQSGFVGFRFQGLAGSLQGTYNSPGQPARSDAATTWTTSAVIPDTHATAADVGARVSSVTAGIPGNCVVQSVVPGTSLTVSPAPTVGGTGTLVVDDRGIYVKLRSGSLGLNRELLITDPEIGGNRDVSAAEFGPVSYAGQYSFYPRMDALASILAYVSGAVADSVAGTGTTQVGTHTISTASSLPWISVEEQIGNGFDVFNYTDAKVDALSLSIDAKGMLEGTMDVMAIKQTAGNTPTLLANQIWDTTPVSVGTNITCTYNGVTMKAKSVKLSFKNNIEKDDWTIGSFLANALTEKRRELMLTFKVRPQDNTLWRQACYGTSGATQPGGTPTTQQAILTFTTWELIGTTATPYSCTITMPSAILKPHKITPSGDNILEEDFDMEVIRPAPGTDLWTPVVVNDLAVTV